MNKLIPKHQRKSPIVQKSQAKQDHTRVNLNPTNKTIKIQPINKYQSDFNLANWFAQTYYNSKGFEQRFNNAQRNLFWPKGYHVTKLVYKTPKFKILQNSNNAFTKINGKYDIGYGSDNTVKYGTSSMTLNPMPHEFGHVLANHLIVQSPDDHDYGDYKKKQALSKTEYASLYPVFRRNKLYRKIMKTHNYPDAPITNYWLKANQGEFHDAMPQESYGDLLKFRQLLYQAGVYDSTKANNPFTQKHLNTFKQNHKDKIDSSFQRFFENFSDQDIIEMMNTVAQNTIQNDKNKPVYAKYGIKLIQRK